MIYCSQFAFQASKGHALSMSFLHLDIQVHLSKTPSPRCFDAGMMMMTTIYMYTRIYKYKYTHPLSQRQRERKRPHCIAHTDLELEILLPQPPE
jgi:hypothetical protein